MPETSAPDRGLAALRRKDHRAAIADFRRHLAEHPEDATAWHNLGLALSRMEEWQPARDAYLAALKRAPSQAETHNALGLAFRHLGDAANAEKAYRNALRHDPRLAAAWNNLGQLHILGRDYARAMKALARALELDPDNPAIRGNVGLAHYQAGRPAAAAAAWEREFVLRQPELAWNQALAALGRRDWESGWRLYEARFFRAPRLAVGRHFTALPRWHGQPLPAGARLRVWGEQGAGDQIQFARFLPALRALGVPLTLACHYGLAPLFAASFGDVAVEPLKRGEQAGQPGELAVPLCDLPACLGLKASTDYYVPAPYLTPSRAARERWAARLPAAPGRPARVGLVWAGAGTHVADALRSLPFEAIARLVAAHPEIEFHSLQVGPHADDLVGSGLPLRDWSALLRDYDDTAALIERLDRVLSVDTSVAHLAGALGRPAEVLLKFEPEWRWSRVAGGDPAATFWYPSLHLLRQPAPGDWAPPLAAADAALAALRPGPDPAGPRGAPALPAAVAAFLARPFAVAQLEALLAAASAARQASALRHGRVAAADPACAALLIRRMAGAGQQREARPMLAAYLRQRPDDFDLTLMAADLARQAHDAPAALAAAKSALALRPLAAKAHLQLGNALRAAKRLPEARAALEEAVRLDPGMPGPRNNLGVVLKELGDLPGSIVQYRAVLAGEPDSLSARANLGNALRDSGEFVESEACFRTLLARHPDNPEYWYGLGNTLKEAAQLAAAIAAYRQGLAVKPDHSDLKVNLSLMLLLTGQLGEGWDMYEERFLRPERPVPARPWRMPRWDGGALRGRRLLLWGEQGVGDRIMFARLLPRLGAAPGQVTVETDRRLLRLMARNFPSVEWFAETTPPRPPAAQSSAPPALQAPMGALARHFTRSTADFDDGGPYLTADPALAAAWRERLGAAAGRRVGFVWAGNPEHANDRNRSLPLDALRPLWSLPGIDGISLQLGPQAAQIAACGAPLREVADGIRDFEDTAALLACLDLVITVDTSVAHLAGALGVPAWVLLPFSPDWRWMTEFEATTPWYRSLRLYRQHVWRDWGDPLARMAKALAAA
jgi:tetratricopeptide (TPR) repeat protein